jgi:hypothetical protein
VGLRSDSVLCVGMFGVGLGSECVMCVCERERGRETVCVRLFGE